MKHLSLLIYLGSIGLVHLQPTPPPITYVRPTNEEDSAWWKNLNAEEINEALTRELNQKRAKNIIIFLGDGMGLSTLTATRILSGQRLRRTGEEGNLFFEKFPHFSLIKTYSLNRQVSESAGTASAIFTGVKTNSEVLGVTSAIHVGETNCDTVNRNTLQTILSWALESGKVAGFVTNTRVTHATPAALYSHIAHRIWEDDSKFPTGMIGECKDIAAQLIDRMPGRNLSVILGGGWKNFYRNDSLDERRGNRRDRRNLIQTWHSIQADRHTLRDEYKFVNNSEQMHEAVADSRVIRLFGLFSESNMALEAHRETAKAGGGGSQPSLSEMVKAAITVLKRANNANNESGFFLFVEGGRIDHAHHDNTANLALHETLEFDQAVKTASDAVDSRDTLVMVTADHSHTFTLSGYPHRGTNIMGGYTVIGYRDKNNKTAKYPTVMYATGPGHQNGTIVNVTGLGELNAKAHSAVYLNQAAHGGEDVGVYAKGPWSHLFSGLKDQTYIAHVAAFAGCLDQYADKKHCKEVKTDDEDRRDLNRRSGGTSCFVVTSHYILLFACLLFIILS